MECHVARAHGFVDDMEEFFVCVKKYSPMSIGFVKKKSFNMDRIY
jgi:hypothetical protein